MITINHTTGPRNKAQRVCGTHIGIFVLRAVPVLSQSEIACILNKTFVFPHRTKRQRQTEKTVFLPKIFWGKFVVNLYIYKTMMCIHVCEI